MSHRNALAASIALTLILGFGIFTARARLFDPSTTDGVVTTMTPAVVDTSGDTVVSGETLPVAESERFIDDRDDDEDDAEERTVTRGEQRDEDRDEENQEDENHDDEEADEHDDD